MIAVGVNSGTARSAGRRTGPSEAEAFWKGCLRSLADRGRRGVRLIGALMLEQRDEWPVCRCYTVLEGLKPVSDDRFIRLLAVAA